MESDVPLIEITGEDDSLLQSIQDDTVSSSNRTANDDPNFFCSPLQPRRSKPAESVIVNLNPKKPSSPLCRDGVNKENTDANKVEEQKLGLPPQKMKRKKKGGGYNLRKSLAWDRAFFTDEGVLNSEELSMISGSANSNGLLSVIHEDADCISDSVNLHALEENLFKVLSESPSNKDRIVSGSSLTKHDSLAKDDGAPGSAARRKVLSARDINRSGSKRSGCPRPVASSSLKRPANVNTMKSPTKEPKVCKALVPKPDPCLLSRTSKNVTVGTSVLNRNQIAHAAVKLNNTKTGPSNAKVTPAGKSLTSKSSVRQARRNVASMVKGSPTKKPCPPTVEANNEVITKQARPTGLASYGRDDRSRRTAVPQVISKQKLPSTGHALYGRNDKSRKTAVPEVVSKQALPSTCHASYGCDDRSRKTAVSLPPSGVNLLHTQLPTSKPSGLRMPSPSLSFFHQPEAPSLPSPFKKSPQPCKISNLKQVGSVDLIHELRPPSLLGKKQNAFNDGTTMGNTNVQCSSSACSVLSNVNPATKDKVEPFLQITNMQKVELKELSCPNSYDVTENKFNSISVHEEQQSTGQAEQYVTDQVFHMEEVEFQRSDDKFLLQEGSCEQLDKDDDSMKVSFVLSPKSKGTDKPHVTSHLSSAVKFAGFFGNKDITDQLLEEKPHNLPQKNSGVLLKPKSEGASSSTSILISYDSQSSSDHNVNDLHGERVDLLKPLTCEGNRVSNESQMVWENTDSFTKECQASEEIQSNSCVKLAHVSPEVQNNSASELERSDVLSDSRFEDQEKYGGSTFETVGRNPHVEDAQMLDLGGRCTNEMNDVDLSFSAPDNCQSVIIDCGNKKPEQPHLPSSRHIREQIFQENRLHLNDCVLDGFSIFPEESQKKKALECVESKKPEAISACSSESEVSRTPSLLTPAVLDCWSNMAKIVEPENADNLVSVSEDGKSGVENYNLDSQIRNGFQLHSQDYSLELESMDEDQIEGAETAQDMNPALSKSGDFMSQLNLKVQVEGGSALRDIIKPKDCNLSVECSCRVPQLQPEDDKSYCQQDTSIEHIILKSDKLNFLGEEINVTSGKTNVGKHNVEQAKLVMSCFNVEDRILNQSSVAHGCSFEGRETFEECHTYKNENCARINSKITGTGGSGLQSLCGLSKLKSMGQANKEVDGGSDMIKESFPGEPPEQSVANCACSTVINDVCELSECPELQHPNIGAIRGSQGINPGSCLNGTLLCEESKEIVQEFVLDDFDSCGSESKSSKVAPAINDGRHDLEEKADNLQMEVAVTSSPKIEPSSENQLFMKYSHDNKLSKRVASLESDSSEKTTNEETSVSTLAYNSREGELCSSVVSDQTSSGCILLENGVSVLLENEVNEMSGKTLAGEAEINSFKNNHTLSSELQHELEDTLHPTEDKDAKKELKKPGSDRKQDALVIKPPADAVPFSDEWLAAIEAAGEEILTKKSGAVQNSPPSKSEPQLGPWSPVKRKTNQVIGPFDCTKHTNNVPPTSQ